MEKKTESNPRMTKADLAEENERLWSKLEGVYDALEEVFDEDEPEEDDED